LLDHIVKAGVLEQHGICAAERVFLRLSGRAYVDVDQATCLNGFCEEVLVQLKRFDARLGAQLVDAGTRVGLGYRGLRMLFRSVLACGFRSVLVLDDFDGLAQNDLLEDSFFAALRSLATGYQVTYLVASRRPLYELEKARPEASTLCGICQQFLLCPFADTESRELILDYLSRSGVEFPPFAVDCIVGLGREGPGLIQLAGYHAFEVWRNNGGQLQERDCLEVRQRFGQAIERTQA
jgi:hypothetical protein